MKNTTLLLILLLAYAGVSAQTKADIFNKDVPVTYLGIDLSQAKFIGDRERYGSESDMRRLAHGWNDLFLKEPGKFNVARAIDRKSVTNSLNVTNDHNDQLDLLSQYSDKKEDYEHLKLTDVDAIVKDYDFGSNSGIGLMFVVESFSKLNGKAGVWVTFVNMDAKEVLFTIRMEGDPGGAGLRNYWANSIYEILERMKNKEFDKWAKLHAPKQ